MFNRNKVLQRSESLPRGCQGKKQQIRTQLAFRCRQHNRANNCRNILKSEHSFSSACSSTTAQTSCRETPTLTTPSSLARSYSISISNLLIENTRDFKLHLPSTAHPNQAALLQSTSHNHSWQQLCLTTKAKERPDCHIKIFCINALGERGLSLSWGIFCQHQPNEAQLLAPADSFQVIHGTQALPWRE